jgi:hypothetical protein
MLLATAVAEPGVLVERAAGVFANALVFVVLLQAVEQLARRRAPHRDGEADLLVWIVAHRVASFDNDYVFPVYDDDFGDDAPSP